MKPPVGKPRVLGHRGYSARYPENTRLAFLEAFKHGADGIECDVQKSRDGRFVIRHDDRIGGQTILELKGLLELIPSGKFLDLELKADTVRREDCPSIGELLHRFFDVRYLMVSSFDPDLLAHFKQRGMAIGLIVGSWCRERGLTAFLKLLLRLKPEYLNLPVQIFDVLGERAARLFVRVMRSWGRKIAFWTVNTREELDKVRNLSEIVITDEVESVLCMLGG